MTINYPEKPELYLGYLSWETIYDCVCKALDFPDLDYRDKIILMDLQQYLSYKGFERFKSFDELIAYGIVSPNNYYEFDDTSENVNFMFMKEVKGDKFYELC